MLVLVGAGGIAFAVLVAWLMAPRVSISPVPVDPTDWFDPEELRRADAFRDGQRLLYLGQILAQLIFLSLLVFGPTGLELGRRLSAAERRPVVVGLLTSAAILTVLQLVALGFGLAGHFRAVDVGLSVQSTGGWLIDYLISSLIFVSVGSLIASGVLWLGRKFGSRWWLPGSIGVIALAALFVWAAPPVLAPIFNHYEPLEAGPVREETLRLARAAGVDVGEVYRVDASRRTTGINAFVDGLGSTKRVVLYDTLLAKLPPAQIRSVVAHELAHAQREDVVRGLVWFALVVPAAVLFVALVGRRLAPGGSGALGMPASIPSLLLATAVVVAVLQVVGNGLSRAVELNADERALELTDSPRALIGLQQRLVGKNLGDPDPPGWSQVLLGTHPSADRRIGLALAWENEHRRP